MTTIRLRNLSISILVTLMFFSGYRFTAGAERKPIEQLPLAEPNLGATSRISVASDGSQGDENSSWTWMSADGRYVTFQSRASNLVDLDTNYELDVFVHDRQTGANELISIASDGTQGNYSSGLPSISADGRFVVFYSSANNLVSGDTNYYGDIFVHDRQTGATERVSVASDGSQANYSSRIATISADGRFVAFDSEASNLVSGDTNGFRDIFVHDRQTKVTECISVASDGSQGDFNSYEPTISADGRYVAFHSGANNLVEGDANNDYDVFVHDRQAGVNELISIASDGTQGNLYSRTPSISADGRFVAFYSKANTLVEGDTNGTFDVFVHDRQTGVTDRISVASDGSQGDDSAGDPFITADGRYVAFISRSSNLASGDNNRAWDIFVHDRQTGMTDLVSVASNGSLGNEDSLKPSISTDGQIVAFFSYASNLVNDDSNICLDDSDDYENCADIFVHDRQGSTGGYTIYLPTIAKK